MHAHDVIVNLLSATITADKNAADPFKTMSTTTTTTMTTTTTTTTTTGCNIMDMLLNLSGLYNKYATTFCKEEVTYKCVTLFTDDDFRDLGIDPSDAARLRLLTQAARAGLELKDKLAKQENMTQLVFWSALWM